jgi:hypothetical protein
MSLTIISQKRQNERDLTTLRFAPRFCSRFSQQGKPRG